MESNKSKKSKKKGKKSQNSNSEIDSYHSKAPATKITKSTNAFKCEFCHFSHSSDLLECGGLYQIGEIYVHYFCVLFSAEGQQNGEDAEGMLGFLLKDIKAEYRRSQRLRCKYCDLTCANARCKVKGCGAVFHYRCGQENDGLFQFKDQYYAFCDKHRLKQKRHNIPATPDKICVFCREEVYSDTKESQRLVAPCCGKYSHSDCVQKMAFQYGQQHMKCPCCNNTTKFIKEILQFGIYLPVREAAWEEDEDFYNYREHLNPRIPCQLEEGCLCKDGPKSDKRGTQWEIIKCDWCGMNGIHVECGRLDKSNPEFGCNDCTRNNEPDKGIEEQAGLKNVRVDMCRLSNCPSTVKYPLQPPNSRVILNDMVARNKVRLSKTEIGMTLVTCTPPDGVCGITIPFNYLHTLTNHIYQAHETKPYSKQQITVKDEEENSVGFAIRNYDKKKYHCLLCDKKFQHLTWVKNHVKKDHNRNNNYDLPSTSEPIECVTLDESESENELEDIKDLLSDESSANEEENSTDSFSESGKSGSGSDSDVCEIKYSYKPGPKSKTKKRQEVKPKLDRKMQLYVPKKPLDISSLNLDELKKAKKEKSYIGDTSYQERRVLWMLWKHLNEVLGDNDLSCPQCQTPHYERWQLYKHLSEKCTLLLDQFGESVGQQFISAGVTPLVFNFLKEKLFSFLGQTWCLICARNLKVDGGFSLQRHLIDFHLKKWMTNFEETETNLYKCTMSSKTYVGRNCGKLFPSELKVLHHLARVHSLTYKLLKDDNVQRAACKDIKPDREDGNQCPKCGMTARNSSSLNIHLAGHTRHVIIEGRSGGGKCTVLDCPYESRFSQEELVRHYGLAHIELLGSDKVPDSSVGNKRAVYPSTSERRVKESSWPMSKTPFQCIQCSEAFSTYEELKIHKKTHEASKKEMCEKSKETTEDQKVKVVKEPEVVDLEDSDDETNVVETESPIESVDNFLEAGMTFQISDVFSLANEESPKAKVDGTAFLSPEPTIPQNDKIPANIIPSESVESSVAAKVKRALEMNALLSQPSTSFVEEPPKPTLPQHSQVQANIVSNVTAPPPLNYTITATATKNPPKKKRPFKCPVCQANFRFSSLLKNHMGKLHFWTKFLHQVSESPPFACPQKKCGLVLPNRDAAVLHLVTEHEHLLLAYAQEVLSSFTFGDEETSANNDESVSVDKERCHVQNSSSNVPSNSSLEHREIDYIGYDAEDLGQDLVTDDGDVLEVVQEHTDDSEVVITHDERKNDEDSDDEITISREVTVERGSSKRKEKDKYRGFGEMPPKKPRYEDADAQRSGMSKVLDSALSRLAAPSTAQSRENAPMRATHSGGTQRSEAHASAKITAQPTEPRMLSAAQSRPIVPSQPRSIPASLKFVSSSGTTKVVDSRSVRQFCPRETNSGNTTPIPSRQPRIVVPNPERNISPNPRRNIAPKPRHEVLEVEEIQIDMETDERNPSPNPVRNLSRNVPPNPPRIVVQSPLPSITISRQRHEVPEDNEIQIVSPDATIKPNKTYYKYIPPPNQGENVTTNPCRKSEVTQLKEILITSHGTNMETKGHIPPRNPGQSAPYPGRNIAPNAPYPGRNESSSCYTERLQGEQLGSPTPSSSSSRHEVVQVEKIIEYVPPPKRPVVLPTKKSLSELVPKVAPWNGEEGVDGEEGGKVALWNVEAISSSSSSDDEIVVLDDDEVDNDDDVDNDGAPPINKIFGQEVVL